MIRYSSREGNDYLLSASHCALSLSHVISTSTLLVGRFFCTHFKDEESKVQRGHTASTWQNQYYTWSLTQSSVFCFLTWPPVLLSKWHCIFTENSAVNGELSSLSKQPPNTFVCIIDTVRQLKFAFCFKKTKKASKKCIGTYQPESGIYSFHNMKEESDRSHSAKQLKSWNFCCPNSLTGSCF